MSYVKVIPSLEERASLEVALNLSQESSFKATALCLERPTYGFIYDEGGLPFFVSNPKKLFQKLYGEKQNICGLKSTRISALEQHKPPPFVTDPQILLMWKNSNIHYTLGDWTEVDGVGRWYFAVEEQCQKLTETLPQSLKFKICIWLYRIALEYISYCRRLELLFGVSRYFMLNFLTRSDWMETCRLNEKRLAERLLKDTRLTILQHYRIACVYCLLDDIPVLWNRLGEHEKKCIWEKSRPTMSRETNNLIQIWSTKMNKNEGAEVILRKKERWSDVVLELVQYGNLALLKPFWKRLEERERLNMVIDLAVMSVKQWHTVASRNRKHDFMIFYSSRELLLSNYVFSMRNDSISWYNLQSYYSDLILFFLLEMNEDQQLWFFQNAFVIQQFNVLECFLDWPIRNYFLKTMIRLWGAMPKDKYKCCLISLASLYSINCSNTITFKCDKIYDVYYGFLNRTFREDMVWEMLYKSFCGSLFDKEKQDFDYRDLLWKLWEGTPQTYKQNLFQNLEEDFNINEFQNDRLFFIQLLKKSPFQKQDEALFKLIFRDVPQTDRIPMMCSIVGKTICSTLLEKENYSLVDWLLQLSFAEHEISSYKQEFIESENGIKLCFYKLQENRENSLLDLLDWTGYSDSQKLHIKRELINNKSCIKECELLLCRGEFTEVERIMNFCLNDDVSKKKFKARFAEFIDFTLFHNCKFNMLEKILRWCFNAEENKKKFKKDSFTFTQDYEWCFEPEEDIKNLWKDNFTFTQKYDIEEYIQKLKNNAFTSFGPQYHSLFVFEERWEDIKELCKVFGLSPEGIRKLNEKTAFNNVGIIEHALSYEKDIMNVFLPPFRWCLTDEEMVIKFKHHVEEKCFTNISNDKKKIAKERLSFFIKELYSGIGKDVQSETSKDSYVLKIEQKRFQTNESLLPRKRHK